MDLHQRTHSNRAGFVPNGSAQSEEYARYADAHWTELTDRYQPAVLWNDISYPKAGAIPQIFAHYYNTVPEGIIDNRFGVEFWISPRRNTPNTTASPRRSGNPARAGVQLRLQPGRRTGASDRAGQADCLAGRHREQERQSAAQYRPPPDGSISEIQTDRLTKLGAWLTVNGEGIFDTKPWFRASSGENSNLRFTRKGDAVYAFLLERPSSPEVTIPNVYAADGTQVRALGAAQDATWIQKGRDLVVTSHEPWNGEYALALKITPAPWQLVRE